MTFYRALIYIVAPAALLLNLPSCKEKEGEKNEDSGKVAVASEPSKTTEVTVETLAISDFNHEIVSNGKVAGHDHADLYFPSGENVITAVYVKNGQHVRRGEKIATLDTYKLEKEKETAQTALEKAELELQDALIGQGYDPENRGAIPEDVMRLAKLRSGYSEAVAAVAKAEHSIVESTLTAPFDGVVANLSGKVFNRPDASKPFCSVIGNGMDVEFKILEGELAVLSTGDKVEVSPFSSTDVFNGRVMEINPFVDENGLVTIVAGVAGGKGLYDGMNVKVSVQKSLGKQLVVPKSAVVLRSGRQVIFTLDEQGKKAMWNYVETGLENMGHYTVTDGLQEGMKVIVSGNINLAHESPVVVVNGNKN